MLWHTAVESLLIMYLTTPQRLVLYTPTKKPRWKGHFLCPIFLVQSLSLSWQRVSIVSTCLQVRHLTTTFGTITKLGLRVNLFKKGESRFCHSVLKNMGNLKRNVITIFNFLKKNHSFLKKHCCCESKFGDFFHTIPIIDENAAGSGKKPYWKWKRWW